jgi:hypothetical protein
MCRRWSASTTASIPLRYFEVHRLEPDWSAFLDDFQRHWPTDENIYVDFVRDGTVGNGGARTGSSRWRRLTEERSAAASRSFISTCRDRWPSPLTLGFAGCASFGSGWASAYISCHSTAGTSSGTVRNRRGLSQVRRRSVPHLRVSSMPTPLHPVEQQQRFRPCFERGPVWLFVRPPSPEGTRVKVRPVRQMPRSPWWGWWAQRDLWTAALSKPWGAGNHTRHWLSEPPVSTGEGLVRGGAGASAIEAKPSLETGTVASARVSQ